MSIMVLPFMWFARFPAMCLPCRAPIPISPVVFFNWQILCSILICTLTCRKVLELPSGSSKPKATSR
ncbi:zinc finger domain-containing protein, LSD1 subclass [Arthrobacter alpinus]|uniref:Zinc finger domain-containing protein, LSD1 subclass n=1 Tax=Arthrobacter alpinus TaxID=656366 RepID=A0A1H5LMH6_9MICC|nr:zinc finger domain-containing protein, LSD1 subclass [Arthrobacter alpinus]